ncbi:unnamed protein product [Cuscuta campestris]|uniref:Uncharacterized protein n=1 Tax=Cuscuta campestris TaxID=132261 RepID=A0A484NFW0_9ASTE|nr:unnamed protein product [Cuscuta campestris]
MAGCATAPLRRRLNGSAAALVLQLDDASTGGGGIALALARGLTAREPRKQSAASCSLVTTAAWTSAHSATGDGDTIWTAAAGLD